MILLIGESGSGKSYLENILTNKYNLTRVISSTTRAIGENEKNGLDYNFYTEEEFFQHEYIETAKYHDNFYGVEDKWLKNINKDLVAVVEVAGAENIIDYIDDNDIDVIPVVIFFDISKEKRKSNMLQRGRESIEKVEKRLENNTITDMYYCSRLKADIVINDNDLDMDIGAKVIGEIQGIMTVGG
jgi:guanylate kinase